MLSLKCDATNKDNPTDKGKPPERNLHVLDVLHRTEYGGLFFMKTIPLTQGFETMVDDDMYDFLNQWKWGVWNRGKNGNRKYTFYAIRGERHKDKQIKISMHRTILNAPKEFQVDHIDGNGLNNQRKNLRICTCAQNQINRGLQRNNKSGFKGVSWHKNSKQWQARIGKKNNRYIGIFKNKLDAVKAYNESAKKNYGEFARLNELSENMFANVKGTL